MMDVRVIANYFGTPPRVFQLWLDSCGANSAITWVFFTDIEMSRYRVPGNVKVRQTTFLELKQQLQSKFPYPIRYEKPWGFCAFKPLLGTIFSEELQGADYWGWSDCDMLYGDLTPVLKLAEEGYDKIMPNGHFSLIKNTDSLNRFIFEHRKSHEAVALSEKGLSCYDERDFRFTVMHEYGAKQASEVVPYIHLYPRWGHFSFNVSKAASRLLGLGDDGSCPVVFTWKNGHLTGHFALPNHTVRQLDLAYVHFFKRNIRDRIGQLAQDGTEYLVAPTGVCPHGGGLSWGRIRWINRPRMHWKYIYDRLNWKTIYGKLRRFKHLFSREVAQKGSLILHSGC